MLGEMCVMEMYHKKMHGHHSRKGRMGENDTSSMNEEEAHAESEYMEAKSMSMEKDNEENTDEDEVEESKDKGNDIKENEEIGEMEQEMMTEKKEM